MEADGAVDAQNAPTAPWKTLRVFHELPQGFPHQITHDKPRKSPESYWETRIDPSVSTLKGLIQCLTSHIEGVVETPSRNEQVCEDAVCVKVERIKVDRLLSQLDRFFASAHLCQEVGEISVRVRIEPAGIEF